MDIENVYEEDMSRAQDFIVAHNDDIDFMTFLYEIRKSDLIHSDRWSMCYDWLNEHYPEATGSIVTGLTYLTEL